MRQTTRTQQTLTPFMRRKEHAIYSETERQRINASSRASASITNLGYVAAASSDTTARMRELLATISNGQIDADAMCAILYAAIEYKHWRKELNKPNNYAQDGICRTRIGAIKDEYTRLCTQYNINLKDIEYYFSNAQASFI